MVRVYSPFSWALKHKGISPALSWAQAGRYGNVGHRSVEGSGDGGGTATADLLVERHSVLIGRPLGVEVKGGAVLRGEVADALLVGIGSAVAVGLCVPAGEGVARALEGVGGEVLRHTIGKILIVHRSCGGGAGSIVGMEAYTVGVGVPVGRVVLVAVAVVGDADSSLRRIAVAARPASEVVTEFSGIVQTKGGRLVGVGGGVRRSHAATGKVVGDMIGIAGIQ